MEVKDIKLHTVFINSSKNLCIIVEDTHDFFRILSIEGTVYRIHKQRDANYFPTWKPSDKSISNFLSDVSKFKFSCNTDDVKLEIDKLTKLVYPDTVNTGSTQQLSGRASGKSDFLLADNWKWALQSSFPRSGQLGIYNELVSNTDTERRRLLLII